MKLYSMNPVVDREPRVLILGSMPGAKSLDAQMYYANPRNHFWPILGSYFDQEIRNFTDSEKLHFAKAHHLALWDVLAECEREGSLDSAIRHETYNPIHRLINDYPSIIKIGCNGTKAYNSLINYQKTNGALSVAIEKLPSTSPVPGKNVLSYKEKENVWHAFLQEAFSAK
ncbi:DNA-deoxyinosine glycosylase [Salisediminibacterium selenitireducens]|uniref:Uracil-DNA glycosylase-like domain-containing protein n=1 Tax=Bacillus selenitireducens (strain ATCC 700615 / DSM 15326 / MLS10) TaxID=439292 RepID=D6XUH6_BACIE|nr:DNA-deoxyinosine glycosylase [Salisediminibacterium selenitireducens]ADH99462.1 conserved hypothetical protein [[Bacillus] selenitireducens MLS10]